MTAARDIHHDPEPTKSPTNPKMAGVFDRLVDANLELTAAVRELVDEVRKQNEAGRDLADEVRELVKAIKEGKCSHDRP